MDVDQAAFAAWRAVRRLRLLVGLALALNVVTGLALLMMVAGRRPNPPVSTTRAVEERATRAAEGEAPIRQISADVSEAGDLWVRSLTIARDGRLLFQLCPTESGDPVLIMYEPATAKRMAVLGLSEFPGRWLDEKLRTIDERGAFLLVSGQTRGWALTPGGTTEGPAAR